MDTNKTTAIIVSIGLVMVFLTISTLIINDAYINSPNEFTLRFEIENKTQEVINNLNGSIVINNYYGNFTEDITLCKDTVRNLYVNKENGEIYNEDVWENVYKCNFTSN